MTNSFSIDLNSRTKWNNYIQERFMELCRRVSVDDAANFLIKSAHIIVPPGQIETCVFDCDLRYRIIESSSAGGGLWRKRGDFYDDAASYFAFHMKKIGVKFLCCYAHYSRPGDSILEKRPHVVISNHVFLVAVIEDDNASDIATVLRQSRSDQTIGIVSDTKFEENPFKGNFYFFTDVFDGDALILCNVVRVGN
jgi:hypothetical protein